MEGSVSLLQTVRKHYCSQALYTLAKATNSAEWGRLVDWLRDAIVILDRNHMKSLQCVMKFPTFMYDSIGFNRLNVAFLCSATWEFQVANCG